MTYSIAFRRGGVVGVLLSAFALSAGADAIDPFTAPQGPISLGPGEEPSEEEAVVQTSSVLGGFRLAAPAVADEAQAGSTATLVIGGGTFDCQLDFPSLGNPDNNAGCVTDYDRGDGPVFDFTPSSQFIIDVQSVEGQMDLGITIVDADEHLSVAYIEGLTAGQAVVPFNMLAGAYPPADLSLVDNISFTVINQEGQEGRVVLGGLSTDGAIQGGPVVPNDDDIVAEDIPGTYYNPMRDGEGCQLTLERDGATFVLTCYFYDEGEQFWVIGVGQLANGQIVFSELTSTSGAQYGSAFDPNDVVRTNWGSAVMTWGDCNNADLALTPVVAGYEVVQLDLTRIVPTTCGSGGLQGGAVDWMGAFYDPDRDGEGFHLGIEAGEVFIMTWYTYLNGKQAWMIGTGTLEGQQVVFDDIVITSGAGFGSGFDPADVERTPFGEIVVEFDGCNDFTATVDSVLPEFEDLVLDVTKIVPGPCS